MRPLLLALALSTTAAAQPARVSVALDAPTESVPLGVGLEVEDASEVPTAVLAIGARVPVGARWAVDAEVPLALAVSSPRTFSETGEETDRRSALALGNPLVGLTWRSPSGYTVGGAVRLPLYQSSGAEGLPGAASRAGEVWLMVRPEAREAFLPDLASVRLSATARRTLGAGLAVVAEVAPVVGATASTVFIRTTADPGDPAEEVRPVYAVVMGALRAEAQVGRLAAELGIASTRRVGAIDDYFFPNTTVLVAEVALERRVRPALRARLPLSKYGAVGSVGVGVTVGL